MSSLKTNVIEYLFTFKYLKEGKSIMTLDDIVEAIEYCNKKYKPSKPLSTRNPANFFKDFVRGGNSSKNWPATVAGHKMTGKQVTGGSQVFEFIPFKLGQSEAFPDLFRPTDKTMEVPVQTVSLSRESKRLGRQDESWLIQTAIKLNIVEQHLATMSLVEVIEVYHLQTSIKLLKTEIDTLYFAHYIDLDSSGAGLPGTALVTCEAKQEKDPILSDQVIQQVQAAFAQNLGIDSVIPIALKSIKGRGIYVVEFEKVVRSKKDMLEELIVSSEAVYNLVPAIKGINI